VGASVAANKLAGIRAAVCHDTYSAHQGVEHDDMNVLCLGSEVVGAELAAELARAFLTARFDGGERYVRRLEKIEEMEGERTYG
jgi:ribose 5-phosphate isomerase B